MELITEGGFLTGTPLKGLRKKPIKSGRNENHIKY
jgi:hypothetical protein